MPNDKSHSEKLKQKRQEKKNKSQAQTPIEKREVVMHGATLKCPLAQGFGKLVVTSNDILLQDQKWATLNDDSNMVNLQFKGTCGHSKWPAQNIPPPPCMSVINLSPWQKLGSTLVQEQTVLVKESFINCEPAFNTAVAKPIPKAKSLKSEQLKDTKEFIESGIVRKGYTITENGKLIVVTNKGKKYYDSEYADAPSESSMKQNGMSSYDIFNINLTKSYPNSLLEAEMKSVLWSFSDIEDGLGKNGVQIANHFFNGKGLPFTFKSGSNPSNEIKDSDRFKKTFITSLKTELVNRYKSKKYINSDANTSYQITTNLPYYKAKEGMNIFVNEVAAFMGGIQGCEVKFKLYKYKISGQIIVEISKVTFLDTFGAGWEDGGAHGMAKQWIPGLVSMFCLQHFKNVTNKSKYQPFTLKIDVEL